MSEKDTEQRSVMLLTDYSSLLRMHGLSWLIKEHPKVAVWNIVDALKPKALQARVCGDLEFAHVHLKNDVLLFMKHVCRGPRSMATTRMRTIILLLEAITAQISTVVNDPPVTRVCRPLRQTAERQQFLRRGTKLLSSCLTV
jgi:hypothetical protein